MAIEIIVELYGIVAVILEYCHYRNQFIILGEGFMTESEKFTIPISSDLFRLSNYCLWSGKDVQL